MSGLSFRHTRKSDKEAVMKIYDDAKVYMANSGNPDQWNGSYPDEFLIDDDIKAKRSYVCVDGGQIAAVFMLMFEDDKSYDKIYEGSWLNDEPYSVIHRIAVADNMHGKGIAKACIDFCREECLKRGLYNLKIDTYKDNIPMQKTLTKYGFSHCGTVYVDGVLKRMGYQYVIK